LDEEVWTSNIGWREKELYKQIHAGDLSVDEKEKSIHLMTLLFTFLSP
jgi:hypothetical protein